MDVEDTPKRPNKKGLYRFLSVILIAFGLFFIIPSPFEINQANEASDWRPRRAEITDSNLMQFGGGRGRDIPRFVPEISHKTLAERYVQRFAEGRTVDVYVSPDDPGKVVLIRDVPLTKMYLLQAIGGILIALAVYLFFKAGRLRE